MWRFLRNQSKCALLPGGSLHVRAFWSFQNEPCILCAQHGDMICLTRCLTVDLLPPHVGQSGEMLLQKNGFPGMSSVRKSRKGTY